MTSPIGSSGSVSGSEGTAASERVADASSVEDIDTSTARLQGLFKVAIDATKARRYPPPTPSALNTFTRAFSEALVSTGLREAPKIENPLKREFQAIGEVLDCLAEMEKWSHDRTVIDNFRSNLVATMPSGMEDDLASCWSRWSDTLLESLSEDEPASKAFLDVEEGLLEAANEMEEELRSEKAKHQMTVFKTFDEAWFAYLGTLFGGAPPPPREPRQAAPPPEVKSS